MSAKGPFVSDRATASGSQDTLTCPYGVLRAGGEYRLVAIRPILAGEPLFRIEGDRTPRPTCHSVQVGEGTHMDVGPGHTMEDILDRYFWRFLNHGCDPNLAIKGVEAVALRDVEPSAALTFNYNTTEWDMATPFRCHCRSPQCQGTIRGFRHLTAAQRERLQPPAAPYLFRLAAKEPRMRTDARGPYPSKSATR